MPSSMRCSRFPPVKKSCKVLSELVFSVLQKGRQDSTAYKLLQRNHENGSVGCYGTRYRLVAG
jgi:hypothetical protein